MAPSPTDLLDRAQGRDLTNIATQGLGAWVLALVTAAITGVQAVVDVLLVPIEVIFTGTDSLARESVEAFFVNPLDVVASGADASSTAVGEFGIFGLIIAVAVVLASLFLIIRFIEEEETTDVPIPGLIADLPIPFFTVDEEPESED